MSKEQIDIAIGFSLLLLALFDFFGVNAVLLRGKLQQMTVRRVILGALILGGLAFSGFGFYQTVNHHRVTPGVTTENIETKVREWLEAFELTTQKIPADPNMHFGYIVTLPDGGGHSVTIAQTRKFSRYLTLLAQVELSDEHKAQLQKLSEAEQRRFLLELRFELASAKVQANMESPLRAIKIIKLLPVSSALTEAALMEAIDDVYLGELVVIDAVNLGFDRRSAK
jgi:hypothetical protein